MLKMSVRAAMIGLLLWSWPVAANEAPGSTNPAVTQDNLDQTICRKGWVKKARPSTSYTGPIKDRLLPALADPRGFELDHVVPIAVGGCPKCVNNLQLQRWSNPAHHRCNPALMDAGCKDRLENFVHRKICTGKMTLAQGQSVFLGDWTAAYRGFFPQ